MAGVVQLVWALYAGGCRGWMGWTQGHAGKSSRTIFGGAFCDALVNAGSVSVCKRSQLAAPRPAEKMAWLSGHLIAFAAGG